MKFILLTLFSSLIILPLNSAFAHKGGTDKYGCHVEKATSEYHCHKGHYDGKTFKSKDEGLKYINENGSKGKITK